MLAVRDDVPEGGGTTMTRRWRLPVVWEDLWRLPVVAGRLVGVAGGTGRLVEVTRMGGHMRTAGDGWGSGDPGIPRTCGPRGRSDQYSPVT